MGCGFAVLVLVLAVILGGMLWPAAGFVVTVTAIAIIVVLLLAVAGLVTRLLRSATVPVDQLIDAAGRVQAGDYSARVAESGPAELRSLARAFNQMSERLESTDVQRRAFMADVSHELRTPLAVIQGQLEAVRDGVYPPDAAHLAPALDQVTILGRLVDDLRILALSESGSLSLAREPLDLGSLATEVVASFRPTAEAAGIALLVEVAPGLPRAYADRVRFGSVVRNLVANALRYTPSEGSVTVGVRALDPAALELTVRDTGRGIDAELLPVVFERSIRSGDSTGSGLGLAIARSIVEAHGGSIAAESVPGVGTTMTIVLPIAGS